MQISRLLEILYLLLDKKTITAKELAGRFEVSQRTVYRDIETLSLAGFPVYTTKGKGGGIHMLPEFVLNKALLNEREQTEILAALQSLSALQVDETDGVLQKLSTVFQKNAQNWIEVDFSDWGYGDGELFALLKSAVLEKRQISFDYFSSYGEKTRRTVEPLQLWFKHRAWYLKAFCLNKQGERVFKLTRMKNVQTVLTPRAEWPGQAAESASDRTEPRAYEEITLTLKIAPQMAFRVYDEFNENAVQRHEDGSFTATACFPHNEWVYGFVLSFGEYAEVLSPPYLRGQIAEKLKKTLQQYL
ncbi:MAG: YafY family transcriptional regulator [Oscillospiraceae bacterium]|jgi:predicted DNA-binding transcriptional regulator YafY|nr:YafY family transcriptional regulator [Oscillospiraceae bacterium]